MPVRNSPFVFAYMIGRMQDWLEEGSGVVTALLRYEDDGQVNWGPNINMKVFRHQCLDCGELRPETGHRCSRSVLQLNESGKL